MSDLTPLSVLLVEDDLRLAEHIHDFLEKEGYVVGVEGRGDNAVQRILSEQPNLVILDVTLPGMNGFDVCRKVRPNFAGAILMLTAKDDDVDQIVGLEIGADDYVIKPVEPRVLLARVRSLLRRSAQPDLAVSAGHDEWALSFGGLHISAAARDVELDGMLVDLTTAEFDLLWILASNAGQILDRDSLFKRLRGLDYDGLDRSLDVSVSRLRKKLGDDGGAARRIKTVRRKGYLFVADAW